MFLAHTGLFVMAKVFHVTLFGRILVLTHSHENPHVNPPTPKGIHVTISFTFSLYTFKVQIS